MQKQPLKKIASQFKQELLDHGIPVTAIYLFGSHVHGQAHRGSDIDLCVVSPKFGRDDFEDMVTLNQLAKGVALEIEAFPVPEEELKNRSNPFMEEALTKGVRLI